MTYDLDQLPQAVTSFLTERHLATLTTSNRNGDPHVTPVGVTWDPATLTARVITWAAAVKARNTRRTPGGRAAVCQVDGSRWLTLYGPARLIDDPESVANAEARYEARYRKPKERDDRVVIEIAVDHISGNVR